MPPNMAAALTWANDHPERAAAAAGAVLVALALTVLVARWCSRRAAAAIRGALQDVPAAVTVAAIAAVGCTAYSADTSWRFADSHLDMNSSTERAAMFAAAELALFATALMARQNLQTSGAPGTPGVLVWVITGVQIIPAYAESGIIGGTVRAFVGPVLGALLWHHAMGIELRHLKPGALSNSIAARLGRDIRERLLSRLGLATRGRDAEQITRDRWTSRAVELAVELSRIIPQTAGDGQERVRRGLGARLAGRRGRKVEQRLAAAVGRAGVGTNPEQRDKLLDELAALRNAGLLATIELASPWAIPDIQPAGRSRRALVGAELRAMDTYSAVNYAAAANPHMSNDQLACFLTSMGVVVGPDAVAVALHHRRKLIAPAATNRPPAERQAAEEPEPERTAQPEPEPEPEPERPRRNVLPLPARPSVRDTILRALIQGTDPNDVETLKDLVHGVHGKVAGNTFSKSRSRAIDRFEDLRSEPGQYDETAAG